jgi:MarR family transcriptional regulator, organic hydroperoxide resistance regulator
MPLTVSRAELLVTEDDAVFRQAIHDALGFSSRLEEIRNGLAALTGLTGPAYSILIAIEHLSRETEVGISAVGEHLHLSGAFVTNEVNKLVKAGLVGKRQHRDDGRRVVLTVTAQASRLLNNLAPIQRPVNDAIFATLTRTQFRNFAQIIASLVNGTKEALPLLQFLAEQQRRRA